MGMTREEAINKLYGLIYGVVDRQRIDDTCREVIDYLKAQENEALDMPKPDSDIGCWYDITHNYTLKQVVSALKEQEPRVMTLEEVEQEKVMWLETNNHEWSVMSGVHETVLRTDDDRYDFSDIIVQFVDQECCEIICARDRFGIEWRCWTSRPTKEQMEAAPWN